MKITSLKRKNICAARFLSAVFVATALILSISTGSSLAFNTYEGLYDEPTSDLQKEASFAAPSEKFLSVPPSVSADVCIPLLKNTFHIPSASAMDRNRRSAGKAAALSLVLGVRFALSPSDNTVLNVHDRASLGALTRHTKTTGNNRSALSVSAYRQCQKQQALKALSASR